MKLTTLSRAGRTFTSWISGAALLLIAPLAMAVPPSFNGTITAPMPAAGQTVIINLRQQGVLSGSAPISITTGQGVVLLNGQFTPSSGLTILPFDPNPSSFGTVCVVIGNVGYSPSTPGTLSAQLGGTNLQSETGGTGLPGLTIVDAAGPVVNPNDTAACEDPNQAPIANAGPDRTIVDTNGAPGENVVLAGSATDPEGGLLTYEWYLGNSETPFATGPTPTVSLPDGPSDLRLIVSDEGGETGTDTVNIVVHATVGPTANAGADRVMEDTDGEDGEDVVLDGSLSTDTDGTITTYTWSQIIDGQTEVALGTGTGPTLQVRLADGDNDIRLVITDNTGNQASDRVVITVSEGATITTLSDIPNLTPNQRRVAQALDRICSDLRDLSGGEGQELTGNQQDLLVRCDGLQTGNTTGNQVAALEELVADDFAVARTQTLLFANTQYASVMDRLMALRGGARGLSLAGLNIIVDGKPVPLAQLQDMAKGLLGGGASADEPGGLLSDKWGMWARGNFSFGEKDRNTSSPAFDADQWAMVGGLDYRFSDKLVGGLALAYGQSSIEFDPRDEGALDTDTWAISLYGSTYAAKNFYFDGIVNIAKADYGADRNITYVDGTGLVNVDASGDTDGMTYSAGLSGGYDFLIGGLTLSPNLGLFYIDATIDGFSETGAGGLNLLYDEQTFQSFTGNVGFRATYAWNLSWGVLLPHVRIDYVREFKDDADVFGVRFAADPNAPSTPPILVETDNPDESYWRLATGFSAQFIHGISAYIEYQRLESFEFISFQDVSLGLRLQRSF
jgi:outer membrane autotransporter protein